MLRALCPLPEPVRGHACARCDKPQAVWRLSKDETAVCSLCVLYDPSVWSKHAESTITGVEVARGRMFERDPSSRIVACADADGIVGVLVLTDRVSNLSLKAQGLRGP